MKKFEVLGIVSLVVFFAMQAVPHNAAKIASCLIPSIVFLSLAFLSAGIAWSSKSSGWTAMTAGMVLMAASTLIFSAIDANICLTKLVFAAICLAFMVMVIMIVALMGAGSDNNGTLILSIIAGTIIIISLGLISGLAPALCLAAANACFFSAPPIFRQKKIIIVN